MASQNIESVLTENRTFSPPDHFVRQANLNKSEYERLLLRANSDFEGYWAELGEKYIHWFKKWNKVLEWKEPFSKWFVGGKTNISYNCLDRHLKDKGNKTALIWIGENNEERKFTCNELHKEVCKFSNVRSKLGIIE